jgi:hypothetical protein
MRSYKPYVPQTPGELWDLLGAMMLGAPRFINEDFPGANIDTEFFELTEGLKVIRDKLGEERYTKLLEMSERAKAHFVAAVDEDADDVSAGRNLLLDMENVLNEIRRRKPRVSAAPA